MPKKKPTKVAMSTAEFNRRLAEAGMSQGKAAEELGVSLRSVNRWANGGRITQAAANAIRALIRKKT